MIPGIILEFLNRASVAMASTRDSSRVPHLHHVSAWEVSQDAMEITCFIPSKFNGNLLSSLEDNGQFTLTVEQIGPHETYQFKGDYIDSRPFDETDQSIYEDCRERFVSACLPRFGISEDVLRRYISKPGIAVRFKVRELFVQTPGPSAGKRLVPPEEH